MNIRQKLEIIQKNLGISQTKLAEKLGVSFVAFNNWWNSKAIPRRSKLILIDELFLEVTGQKVVPKDQLTAKKQILYKNSKEHKKIINTILNNPDIKDLFILKLTYHSNKIEGSTLTEADTSAILFDNVALPNKSLIEQIEAKNHQTALNYVFDYVYKNKKIDIFFILKLHSILMNGIQSDAGFYRNHAVRILGVNLATANYLSVPKLMLKIIDQINRKNIDVVASSVKVHSKFEQIHPFSDGNGRVGRLLMNAMLLSANFAPAIIQQEKKRLYYNYLYKAQTKEDFSQLENFVCDAIMEGFSIINRD